MGVLTDCAPSDCTSAPRVPAHVWVNFSQGLAAEQGRLLPVRLLPDRLSVLTDAHCTSRRIWCFSELMQQRQMHLECGLERCGFATTRIYTIEVRLNTNSLFVYTISHNVGTIHYIKGTAISAH